MTLTTDEAYEQASEMLNKSGRAHFLVVGSCTTKEMKEDEEKNFLFLQQILHEVIEEMEQSTDNPTEITNLLFEKATRIMDQARYDLSVLRKELKEKTK